MGTAISSQETAHSRPIQTLDNGCCECRKHNRERGAYDSLQRTAQNVDSVANESQLHSREDPKLQIKENDNIDWDTLKHDLKDGFYIRSSVQVLQPIPNWTIEEQTVLIQSLHIHPQARKSEAYRRRLTIQVQRQLQGKTAEDIELCYRRLLTPQKYGLKPDMIAKGKSNGMIFDT